MTCRACTVLLALFFGSMPLTARGGDLLLVGAANGDAVQQYDAATGAALGNFTSGGLGDGGYSALAFGPSGNLFVRYWSFGGRVDQFDGSTGAFISIFVPPNGGSGGTNIVFSPDGQYFYVTDLGNNIDRHSASTGALVVDDFIPSGSGGLEFPVGMRFGPSGDLYVANVLFFPDTSNVLRFDGATGAFEGQFVTTGSGGLGDSADIVFGPDGNLYVADLPNAVVRRYDGATGAFLGDFASGGGLAAPFGLVFGPGNDLFVSDHDGSDAVLRFDGLTGAFEGVFATGTNPNPTYLAFLREEISIPLDVKPTSCRNPLNPRSKGVLPVAILGTAGFDASQVDVGTVRLEGVAPLRSSLEDVATPFEPSTGKSDCHDCTDEGPDRFTDLTLKFDREAVANALGDLGEGACVLVEITGKLLDGTPIRGEDVVAAQ